MIKNVLIAAQNETRLMSRLDERLARGEVEEVRRILRSIIAGNPKGMGATVNSLDLSQAKRLDDAKHYASLVDDAGIPAVTELIRQRADRQQQE